MEMIDDIQQVDYNPSENKISDKILIYLRRHYSIFDNQIHLTYANGHESDIPIMENKKWLKTVIHGQLKETFKDYSDSTINRTIKEYLNNNLN
jgi:hypothetical protein